jgi:hypothetical protein
MLTALKAAQICVSADKARGWAPTRWNSATNIVIFKVGQAARAETTKSSTCE